MIRFSSIGLEVSIMTFDESNCVWSAVKLFPARSKTVMFHSASILFSSTVTFALAVVPFTIIIDTMPNIVTFAAFRSSFAVIVMFSR